MQESPADDAALLFFREVVEPTVAEFMADRDSKRRGCLACLAVASMTEHYFYARPQLARLGKSGLYGKNGNGGFKAEIHRENKAVFMIAQVANATKHVIRDKPGHWRYDDVSAHQLKTVGILRAGWPIGGNEVLVGPDRDWRLSTLLDVTMAFWREKLGIAAEPGDKSPADD